MLERKPRHRPGEESGDTGLVYRAVFERGVKMYIESGQERVVRCEGKVDPPSSGIINELNNLIGLLGSTSNEAILLAEALRPVSGPETATVGPRCEPITVLDYINILREQTVDLRDYLAKTREILVIRCHAPARS